MNFPNIFTGNRTCACALAAALALNSVYAEPAAQYAENNAAEDRGTGSAENSFDELFDEGSSDSNGEEADDTLKSTLEKSAYALGYRYNQHKGALLYAGFVHEAAVSFIRIAASPSLDFSLSTFGIGIYPLAHVQKKHPEKAIPKLFAGAGALAFGPFLKNLHAFSSVSPQYTGIRFPRGSFLKVSTGKTDVRYGLELSGKSWTAALFTSTGMNMSGLKAQDERPTQTRYGLFGRWHTDNILNSALGLSVQHMSALIPVSAPKGKQSEPHSRTHHALFALGGTLIHPAMALELIGVCNLLADNTLTGFVRGEYNVFYRYIGCNTGVSYTHPHYAGWKGRAKKEYIAAFAQPYVKFSRWSVHGLYSLQTKLKKETVIPSHAFGLAVKAAYPVIRWKGEWAYGQHVHTCKQQLSVVSTPSWFKGIAWFEHAKLTSVLQLKSNDGTVRVKKYGLQLQALFTCVEGCTCSVQASVNETVKQEAQAIDQDAWDPVYAGVLVLKAKKRIHAVEHSVQFQVETKTAEPYVDFSIGYTIKKL
ncbi:MAG: hypothetical protein ACTTI3_04215 [Treponema sp.]